jgi:hypothetical protein
MEGPVSKKTKEPPKKKVKHKENIKFLVPPHVARSYLAKEILKVKQCPVSFSNNKDPHSFQPFLRNCNSA